MGKTSTQVKQRWNKIHYQQVKVSVEPETAKAFKAACATSNMSMAGVLSQFMKKYSKLADNQGCIDMSTRGKRRNALRHLTEQLERIREGEERYIDNMPDNFRNSAAFEKAVECVSQLEEALKLLNSAY